MFNSKKAAAVISYAQIVLNMVYSVLFTPFVLRALGQNEYGVYTLCTSIISYLSMFQFGFGTTFIRYYIKYNAEGKKRKAEELSGMFLEIFGLIALVTLAAGVFLVTNIQTVFGTKITPAEYQLAGVLLKFVVFNSVLSVVGAPFSALVTAHEKFVFQKLLSLAETVLKIAVLFPLLLLGYKSVALVSVSTLLSLITFLANIVFVFGNLKITIRFTHFDFSLFKEIGVFSFFVFLQSVMDMFNWQIDRFLLARFWGSAEVSVYSVGAQINSIYLSLAATITGFFVPRVNQQVAQKKDDSILTALMIRVGRLQFLITTFLLTAFIFFGRPFLRFYAGTGYENTYWVAVLLMSPLVVPLSMDLWYHIARAKAKHKTSTTVFVAVAFLNLLVSIPLCKRYGEIGAAAGTCIGMFVSNNVFQVIYTHKVVGLNMKQWAKSLLKMTPSLVPIAAAGMLIMRFAVINTILQFVVYAVIYTVVAAVSYWLFALNTEERQMFSRPVWRVCQKLRRGVH